MGATPPPPPPFLDGFNFPCFKKNVDFSVQRFYVFFNIYFFHKINATVLKMYIFILSCKIVD